MQIGYAKDDQKLTIYLKGEIDHHNCSIIRGKIDDIIDKEKGRTLILDFNEVTFMDSSGIGVVLGRYKKMLSLGGRVFIEGAGGYIKKIFVLSGIDRIIDIN
jgi:stage II sporulation protein AA (anti-sigma F factor antagonist)